MKVESNFVVTVTLVDDEINDLIYILEEGELGEAGILLKSQIIEKLNAALERS
jgi:hypothetical protein